jgi:predicted RNA binding protein YcfA (HicA-like mRNA interferase family)
VKYPGNIWNQIKNITADEFITALKKDGFVLDVGRGAKRVYRHSDGRRVAIDYHPQKTFGPNLLKSLLDDTGWNMSDLRRLKLAK